MSLEEGDIVAPGESSVLERADVAAGAHHPSGAALVGGKGEGVRANTALPRISAVEGITA
jgi:hypothetical protein